MSRTIKFIYTAFAKNAKKISRNCSLVLTKFPKPKSQSGNLALNNFCEKGDSLVEVLLAISVLTLVAVGSMAVMNRGNALVQNALMRTSVRAQVNSETEMLYYVRDNNSTLWNDIKTNRVVSEDAAVKSCAGTPGKSFYLDFANVATATTAATSAAAALGATQSTNITPGDGLWIDAVYYPVVAGQNAVPYFDFYIKACWVPLGTASGNQSQSLTIERIYDPS